MAGKKRRKWTPEENALLIEHYNTTTMRQLENMLTNRTAMQIKNHAAWLRKSGANISTRKPGRSGGTQSREWTDAEKAILLKHWNTATEAKLAQLLPERNMHRCSAMAAKMRSQGVAIPKRAVATASWWTPEEDVVLIQNWGTMDTKLLLKKLPGRTLQQCRSRADLLRKAEIPVPARHPRLTQTSQDRCIVRLQASLNSKRPDHGVNADGYGKWQPVIRICGKMYKLGRFDNKTDAIAVRGQADKIMLPFLEDLKNIARDTDFERSNQNWEKKLEEIDQALTELKQSIQQQINRTEAS